MIIVGSLEIGFNRSFQNWRTTLFTCRFELGGFAYSYLHVYLVASFDDVDDLIIVPGFFKIHSLIACYLVPKRFFDRMLWWRSPPLERSNPQVYNHAFLKSMIRGWPLCPGHTLLVRQGRYQTYGAPLHFLHLVCWSHTVVGVP